MPLLCADVTFRYRRRSSPIFDDLSWAAPNIGRTVLLGPNGAGKSTLLKLLAGIHRPQQGTVELDGRPVRPRRGGNRSAGPRVAWMPQDITAIKGLTTLEQVGYAGWLAGMSGSRARTRAVAAVEQVQLGAKADERSASLSGGQLRRLGLAEALVLDADYLLLDEPTAGLDPAQRQNFRDILLGLPSGGLVVSTHQTDDIADVFDHVTVLAAGKILFDAGLPEFRALPASRVPASAGLEERVFTALVGGADR